MVSKDAVNSDPKLRWPGYRTACAPIPKPPPARDTCPICESAMVPWDLDGQTLYYCQLCGYDEAGAENSDGTCGEAL